MDFLDLLPPGKRLLVEDNLAALDKQNKEQGFVGSDVVFDLDKKRQVLSKIASTLVTHGHYYSTLHGRGTVPKEHFLMQAFLQLAFCFMPVPRRNSNRVRVLLWHGSVGRRRCVSVGLSTKQLPRAFSSDFD